MLIYLEKDVLIKMDAIKKPEYKLLLQFRYKDIYDKINLTRSINKNFEIFDYRVNLDDLSSKITEIYSYETIYYDCVVDII